MCSPPPANLPPPPPQAVKAAEEEKNKVRAERKRAAQAEILRMEQVQPLAPPVVAVFPSFRSQGDAFELEFFLNLNSF